MLCPMTRWQLSDVPDQTGRTVLVTGANSGLGFQTSLELARKGARVLLACRNPQRASEALGRIRAEVPAGSAELVSLDLSSLDSVERAAEDVAGRLGSLDVLINNAGIMAVAEGKTADGFELQFGTNHLGHFALTGRLMPLLLAADAPRVVTVSSTAHVIGKIDFADLHGASGYGRWRAYGQSKLANLLFASELQKRAGGRVLSTAAHPGYAATHLQSGQGQAAFQALMNVGNRLLAQSDAAGAWPSLYAATMPEVIGGDFYGPRLTVRGYPVKAWRTASAKDNDVATKLWDISEELTKVEYRF
ncbi:MAG: short-chain dehydrogenase/reductase [Frankiales bacterium]|nr:short-chain dehydrogenase/reductase [Frankiales bacterium]